MNFKFLLLTIAMMPNPRISIEDMFHIQNSINNTFGIKEYQVVKKYNANPSSNHNSCPPEIKKQKKGDQKSLTKKTYLDDLLRYSNQIPGP